MLQMIVEPIVCWEVKKEKKVSVESSFFELKIFMYSCQTLQCFLSMFTKHLLNKTRSGSQHIGAASHFFGLVRSGKVRLGKASLKNSTAIMSKDIPTDLHIQLS